MRIVAALWNLLLSRDCLVVLPLHVRHVDRSHGWSQRAQGQADCSLQVKFSVDSKGREKYSWIDVVQIVVEKRSTYALSVHLSPESFRNKVRI